MESRGRINKMLEKLRPYSSYIKEKEAMYKYTSLKIGGEADIFLEVSNINNLLSIIDIFNKENIFYFILGRGSNILVKDGGIKGGVIKLGGELASMSLEDESIVTSAGMSLHKLVNYACDNNLSGIENLYGIPGTVGGAIYCKTQAFGRCIYEVINYVKLIEKKSLRLYIVSASEIDSLYEKNALSDFIVVEAKLSLKKSSQDKKIRLLMDYFHDIRKLRQPIGANSAGCIFKNPCNGSLSAGWLIEKSGLNGTRYNGACISHIHGNFILNIDSAKAADILYLVDLIRDRIRQKFGIELELQIHIYGED